MLVGLRKDRTALRVTWNVGLIKNGKCQTIKEIVSGLRGTAWVGCVTKNEPPLSVVSSDADFVFILVFSHTPETGHANPNNNYG